MNPSPSSSRQTVNGTTFVCTAPVVGRVPSSTSNVQHLVTHDASACQQKCMEEGKNKCNVYGFAPSEYTQNCTIGYASTYTKALAATTDPSANAGYCVASSHAETNPFYPPPSYTSQ